MFNRIKSWFCHHTERVVIDIYPQHEFNDCGPDSEIEVSRGVAKVVCPTCKKAWLTRTKIMQKNKLTGDVKLVG